MISKQQMILINKMVNENNLKPICESIILPVNDPLIIIDHLRKISELFVYARRTNSGLAFLYGTPKLHYVART